MKVRAGRKVIVVTGASSGLGRLTALTLARGGHLVYATMRDVSGRNSKSERELLETARNTGEGNLHVVEIDVVDRRSVGRGIDTILEQAGRIDVLINNAGVMNVGVSEAHTVKAVRRQFEVNFFGVVRMNRAVLPQMRARGSGLLIHVSALGGRLVFPFFGIYCASKHAVEALAESYRYELSSFGVDSILVEPGPFQTNLIDSSPGADDLARLKSYGRVASTPTAMLRWRTEFLSSKKAPEPQLVADAIRDLVDMQGERPLRTVVGVDHGLTELNRAVEPVQHDLLAELGVGASWVPSWGASRGTSPLGSESTEVTGDGEADQATTRRSS